MIHRSVCQRYSDPMARKRRKSSKLRREEWDALKALFDKASSAGMSALPPAPEPKLEHIIAETERQRLFRIIEELVKWDNLNNENILNAARAEIMRSCDGNLPPVYDPFCGGGSIPLEAQRLGLEAHASDLNPVPVLITKALIEIPAKFAGKPPANPEAREKFGATGSWKDAAGLIEDIRYYGKWMRAEAEKRIGHLYPKVKLPKEHGGGEATVIAWLWARTVVSPNPAAKGVHVPLVRSFWLSTKVGRKAWVNPLVDRDTMSYEFRVQTGSGEPPCGTVGRSGATCILTNSPIPLEYVREQGRQGKLGQRLLAVVATCAKGRVYVSPDSIHENAAQVDAPKEILETMLPEKALGFRVQAYGMIRHRDLFTKRQLLALSTFAQLVEEVRCCLNQTTDAGADYAKAVVTYLAFALDKAAEYNCSLVPWYTKEDRPKGLFARHAIPMVWDFAEVNPLGDIGATFEASVRVVSEA